MIGLKNNHRLKSASVTGKPAKSRFEGDSGIGTGSSETAKVDLDWRRIDRCKEIH
jgi:hypothetical protein